MLATNYLSPTGPAQAYFRGIGPGYVNDTGALNRSVSQIRSDRDRAEKQRREWKRIEGPFDVIPGYVKGITVKKYH